jgi:exopolysaccharide biosynthesis polyprenyl glycosylphosphotransferase
LEALWRAGAAPGHGARRTFLQTATHLTGYAWMIYDGLAACAAVVTAHALSPVYLESPLGPAALRVALLYGLAFVLTAGAVGLYDWNLLTRFDRVAGRCLASGTLAMLAALACGFSLVPRLVVWRALRGRRRVIFLGDTPLMRATLADLEHEYAGLYDLVALWRDGALRGGDGRATALEDLPALCDAAGVDEIVLPAGPSDRLSDALRCLPLGCRVRSEADFYEDVFRRVPLRHVTADWLFGAGRDTANHPRAALKRVTDVALAGVLLPVSLLLVVLGALLVKLSDGGPVFYAQLREGRYGRPFRMLKLRTMRTDAETSTAQWADVEDPRRTAIGACLRRTRLDELPQILNVLLGQMSFVGPRPERPELARELERLIPYHAWRNLVRPGITGWAQINLPYVASPEAAERRLAFDLYYLRHASIATDLAIALRTLTALVKGAR